MNKLPPALIDGAIIFLIIVLFLWAFSVDSRSTFPKPTPIISQEHEGR